MRIKSIKLDHFKRFSNLTISLGENPKKIIALVGPNGCGKSSIFDAIEEKAKDFRGGSADHTYLYKGIYLGTSDAYDRNRCIQIETDRGNRFNKTEVYFRSSYRFTPRISLNKISQLPGMEEDQRRPNTSSDLDNRLEENYARLIGQFFSDVYGTEESGKGWAKKNIDSLNSILERILEIRISNLGNPVENKGCLYFEKGKSKNFPYNNLSSGEKEAVDLLIDIFLKTKIFSETIFCIDEPELHLNTAIQKNLLIEIEKLVPDSCQLWIATHSIGFLNALQENLKDKTQIIDMNECDFDESIKLTPIKPTRKNWQKIFKIALEDLTGLVAPKTIVYCEGKMRNSLDEKILNEIFSEYHDTLFISATNKSEAIKYAGVALTILNRAFDDVQIKVLVDRDDPTINIPKESNVEVCKLKRNEFENYLFDKEIVMKAYPHITDKDYDLLCSDIINTDIKTLFDGFQKLCKEPDLKKLKESLANSITPGTNVYNELGGIIF
ncbi:AAA family ATPase [Legionella resiliens]|uniref:AAA family ATPase n=1 Tax=Legionella resiliens TaxID=2905958 RepID=A0ABS8WZP1_9GAMM|nr:MULTISPECIES: AAA family ATPase [unclassified Legionella]MCE0721842.1 AAA family ATPase [Legionella sp. 9fVS26]MCE3530996.1 AAA family ATPase [Legionella sp. 8cVS16]